ncbi:MAG: hypothetical protein ABI939_12530, partial [Anaerolineaceae bacterium]
MTKARTPPGAVQLGVDANPGHSSGDLVVHLDVVARRQPDRPIRKLDVLSSSEHPVGPDRRG